VKFGIGFAGELNAGGFRHRVYKKAFLFPPEPAEATGRAKPAGQGVSATAETAGKPGDLEA
jgi:hypothetical protein